MTDSFKSQLERDFGVTLAAGNGRARSTDPMELLDTDPVEVLRTAVLVVRLIYTALRTDWLLFDAIWTEVAGERLLEVRFDSLADEDGKPARIERAYFFRPIHVQLATHEPWPALGTWNHAIERFIPWQLGLLHFDRSEDNETTSPGAGFTYEFSRPGTKAGLYIYDRGEDLSRVHTQSERCELECRLACDDILRVYPSAELNAPSCLETTDGRPIWFALGVLPDGRGTFLALLVYRRQFIKLRVTTNMEKPLPMVNDVIGACVQLFSEPVSNAIN